MCMSEVLIFLPAIFSCKANVNSKKKGNYAFNDTVEASKNISGIKNLCLKIKISHLALHAVSLFEILNTNKNSKPSHQMIHLKQLQYLWLYSYCIIFAYFKAMF